MNSFLNGVFVSDEQSRSWPEVEKEKMLSGIYFGLCSACGGRYAGYKRRVTCYPCSQLRRNALDNNEE